MLTHYQTLDVSRSADLGVIKKAYHKISLLHHPDKTVHLPDAERAQREQLFKFANVAFEVLSDPKKRKSYDQAIRTERSRPRTQTHNTAARGSTTRTQHGPSDHHPPDETTTNSEDAQSFQGSQGSQHVPRGSHRFTASTLGKAPEFHWHHCQLNEYKEHTSLTYNNWLGWYFSINVTNYFPVVGKPTIPQNPVQESIVIRLPLVRRVKQAPCASNNVVIDLRGVPGNKHTILCSTLVESQVAGLEVVVELLTAPETQASNQGPVVWKWTYSIDHDALAIDTQARVTSMLFYPYNPSTAIAPRGEMPAPPYPEESPMRRLLTHFPGMKIEQPALGSYCLKEEQQGKTMWRLTAVGSL